MTQTFEPDPAPTRGHAARAPAGIDRLCVLCGEPIRGGQRLIRVHGSTIHAHCSTAHRGGLPRR